MNKEVVIAGIGMGNPDTVTVQVIRAIENADVLIGEKRMLAPFAKYGKKMIAEHDSEAIAEAVKNEDAEKFAILVSGDPGLFSDANSIAAALSEYSPRVMPGISSVSYFCSAIGESWNDAEVIASYGQRINIASEVRRNKKVFVLTDGNISKLLFNLCVYGYGRLTAYIGERLSYSDEKITSGLIENLLDRSFDDLAVMLIINEDADSRVPSGLGDEMFERGSVTMTKREVRAIAMSTLRVLPDSIVYDIGAGTGSVSIEAAYAAYRGTVYAVECDQEAVEILARNCKKLRTDNVEIIAGTAPDAIEDLPAADLVFIGGSDGSLEEIVDGVIAKQKAAGKDFRLVINLVSMKNIASSVVMLSGKKALKIEYTQVAASRMRTEEERNFIQENDPMFIIKADFVM